MGAARPGQQAHFYAVVAHLPFGPGIDGDKRSRLEGQSPFLNVLSDSEVAEIPAAYFRLGVVYATQARREH